MGALDDLIILDLSRILAGPYCTQVLSDLGATVWKIESTRGDDTRRLGPPFVGGESAYYLSINRGKKSIAVNLKDPRGQDIVRGLARRADVVIENFKTGDLARYGLDYDSLAELNPRIVYASITGFGHTGPRRAEPAVDTTLQGLSGMMSVTGDRDDPPAKVGVAIIDLLTGLLAAVGVLSALWERDRSGKGQHLDLSLFDVGLMSMINQAQNYLATGDVPERLGTAHPQIVPYQAFEAQDGGWFMLAAVNDDQYRRLTGAVGHPELWDDERFQTNAGRVEHQAELVPRLQKVFGARPRAAWIDLLGKAGIMAQPVYNFAEALEDPQATARGAVWELAHPSIGTLPTMANALRHMSLTPAEPQGHPPLLGEHTREVLTGVLGMGATEIDDLEEDGVIATQGREGAKTQRRTA